MNTPRRTIRIDDPLWTAAAAKADKEGTDMSKVIRRLLTAYVKAGAAICLVLAFAIPASASTPAEVRVTALDMKALACEASTLGGIFAPSYRCSWTLLFDGAVDKVDLAEQALTAR